MYILYIVKGVYSCYNIAMMEEVCSFFTPPSKQKRGVHMGTIVYDKLLRLMEVQGLSTYRIRKERIISESTLQKIRKNKAITTDSIATLCKVLHCQPGDLMEYVPDQGE